MEKKILLALDKSIHSKYALRYSVEMSSVIKGLTYSLFHTQPTVSQFLKDEAKTDVKAKADLKKAIRKNTDEAQSLLEEYKAQMIGMGIAEKDITVMTQPKLIDTPMDILGTGLQGLYDAIVMGRRGLTRIQEALMGSVTSKLLEKSKVIPVWIVDGEVTSTRIMAAVDGSENSFRAIDHLSFMVSENPDIKITLFHVIPRAGEYEPINFDEKEGEKHFYARALEKLKTAGIQEDRIEVKVAKVTLNVGKAILDEAKNGNYGTVVVGRRKAKKAFFEASVSKQVLDRSLNSAIWIVP
jgi:nucleotide-binding universal stress UspA family protein